MKKITDSGIEFFDANGYLPIPGAIQPDELAALQAESRRLIDRVRAGEAEDEWTMRGPEGIPYYLEYLHSHPNTVSLKLLAHPTILDLAHRMVGPDFVPTFESLVFKLPEAGSSVPWHRDANADHHEQGRRIFNVDIYLDESTVENSCVWVVPGSHRWPQDRIDAMLERAKTTFELPGAVPAEMKPGDLLLHDIMVLHGSTENRSRALRRVIYYEFRSARHILNAGWWDAEWIGKRLNFLQAALLERKQQPYPSDDETYDYARPGGYGPDWQPDDPVELRVFH
ncbi:MAG: phytanoyl-CoA dioxygenase family protein [Armatimonadetes bacterium]|nr:phytanoyl-CoA dioxygenase family protein [Armatimonadota bacterium]